MTDLDRHEAVEVFVGIDVGKGAHHAVALNRAGSTQADTHAFRGEIGTNPLS